MPSLHHRAYLQNAVTLDQDPWSYVVYVLTIYNSNVLREFKC